MKATKKKATKKKTAKKINSLKSQLQKFNLDVGDTIYYLKLCEENFKRKNCPACSGRGKLTGDDGKNYRCHLCYEKRFSSHKEYCVVRSGKINRISIEVNSEKGLTRAAVKVGGSYFLYLYRVANSWQYADEENMFFITKEDALKYAKSRKLEIRDK